MATEQRLIDEFRHELMSNFIALCRGNDFNKLTLLRIGETIDSVYEKFRTSPTVDAVEVDDMRAFAKDVAYQFGFYCQNGGRLHITHGGLSTLEQAFDILGWENPHPVPECECEIDGCHEHATCGAPTADGYKRMCSRHYRERRTDHV